MILNRNNYEEYFILYLDNELDAASRRELEDFVERNPDLKEELELLSQFKLSPDQHIVFPEKSALLKNETNQLVNADNYKDWLLLYIDNELTTGQKQEVELFIANHPAVQKELEIFRKAKLIPETIAFPGKEKLFRHETRVIRIYWWRIAAAAILVLAAGSYFLSRINKGEITAPPATGLAVNKQPAKQTGQPNTTSVSEVPTTEIKPASEKAEVVVKTNNSKAQPKEKKINKPAIESNQQQHTIAQNEKIKSNNLPQPGYNPDAKEAEKNIASLNKNPIVDPEEFKSSPNVTPGITYTSNNQTGTTGDEEVFSEQGGKKSKLRGFLRKVTRTIEKTTNINATDDEDRLLIGGIAIKLK